MPLESHRREKKDKKIIKGVKGDLKNVLEVVYCTIYY